MAVIDEYWTGVLDRVNVEVRTFSRLVAHAGEKGRENEAIFGRLLERLLPARYAVGTGMIINSADGYSRQTDIVLLDKREQPTLFGQSTELLHPIETVAAAIEVKTRFNLGDAEDIGRKVHSIRSLRSKANDYDVNSPYDGDAPYCVSLCYGLSPAPARLIRDFRALPPSHQPDLTCVIDAGLLLWKNDEFPSQDLMTLSAGVALRHQRSADGSRITSEYEKRSKDTVGHELNGELYAAEPARALMLFLRALTSALGKRKPPAASLMDSYLHGAVVEMHDLG